VSGQSKITSTKVFLDEYHKHFCNLHYIEIPDLVARKFDLKEGDSLIWYYYTDKKAAIVIKREGWKSREARMSSENVKR
jgi:bifunctional DNA-binding transcriptional regulator/antitoxin component of YhaV-PrlF toxin-antitoxin module